MGYIVVAICENFPLLKDADVLELSYEKKSLLITEDKDFGELVIRLKLRNSGILLIRMSHASSIEKAIIVAKVVENYNFQLLNAFSVIEKSGVRVRPLVKQL